MGVWYEVRWLSVRAAEVCRARPEVASAFVGRTLDFDVEAEKVAIIESLPPDWPEEWKETRVNGEKARLRHMERKCRERRRVVESARLEARDYGERLPLYKLWASLDAAFMTACPEARVLIDINEGEPLGYATGYGPVRFHDAETVRSIASALSTVGREEIIASYRENLSDPSPLIREQLLSKENVDACGGAFESLTAYLVEAANHHAFLLKYFT